MIHVRKKPFQNSIKFLSYNFIYLLCLSCSIRQDAEGSLFFHSL